MRTATERTNLALFVGLLLIAVLVGLLGAYLADGQVIDGDLTYWRYDDTAEVVDTIGLGQFSEGQIVAVGRENTSVFDGEAWSVQGAGDRNLANTAQGPDGKIWFRTCPGTLVVYWDQDGWRGSGQFGGGYAQDGWMLDIVAWRGNACFVFGRDLNIGADVYTYCAPSCDNMRAIRSLSGPPAGQYGEHSFWGSTVSGDYLSIISTGPPRIIHIPGWDVWDLPDCPWGVFTDAHQGSNGYFWIEHHEGYPYPPIGLLQVDAETRQSKYVDWLNGIAIDSLAMDWRGLWVLAGGSDREDNRAFGVAFWSFRNAEPDMIRSLPAEIGIHGYAIVGWHAKVTRRMTVASPGELWFATDKAVVRWTPEPELIPMPYEARVEAQAKEGGAVDVEIEFDNERIIRNDATLHLKIEFLIEGDTEPIPLFESYSVYHEFQPQETFTYSFDHTPEAPPSADKVRYTVYTTYIDVNAPPAALDDEKIVISNVATAEVQLQ